MSMLHRSAPPRVVSLIASATETVAALGCLPWLVGRSHECDYPPAVRDLPVCTKARVDVEATGVEIDRQIKSLLRDAVSIYELSIATLNRLRPDVILTQSQCEVCAVSLQDVERALGDIVSSRPRIVALEPQGLADVWRGIEQVAEALGVALRGVELVASLRRRLDEVRRRAASVVGDPMASAECTPADAASCGAPATGTSAARPRVACIEWIEPLMAGGNWVPELVEIAGGINLFGIAGRHSPWMTWDELAAADPDVIVVLPCGWDMSRCRREMGPLTERPGWGRLSAVRRRKVYLTDGNQFFNRPGPRVVESAEILAEILHPGQFSFGHEGTGWERF